MTIEGTWEEVTTLGEKLSGRRVRVIVLPQTAELDEPDEDEETVEDEDDAPLTWEEWDREREAAREEISKIWPAGVSAVETLIAERR